MVDFSAIDRAVIKLAESLSAIYIDLFTRKDNIQVQRGPQRLLFPTGTYAARLWHFDEDVLLVCMSEDRPEVFWEIVGDALDIEKLAPPGDSTILAVIPEIKIEVRIFLHHCATPEGFDLSTMDGYGIPLYHQSLPRSLRLQTENEMSSFLDSASGARELAAYGRTMHEDSAAGRHLRMVYDAEVLLSSREGMKRSERQWASFASTFKHIRKWAQTHGLIQCNQYGLGFPEAQTVLWMTYHALKGEDVVSEDEAISTFLKYWSQGNGSPSSIMSPSSRDFGQQIAVAARDAIMHSISATPPASILEHTINSKQAFQMFAKGYSLIKIETECWGTAAQSQAINGPLLARTLRYIQDSLMSEAQVRTVRLWHAPLITAGTHLDHSNHGAALVFAIGVQEKFNDKIMEVLLSIRQNSELDSQEGGCIHISPALEDETSAWLPNVVSQATTSEDTSSHEESAKREKLLDAHKVLKRLQWHPNHRGVEYEVGYRDRFMVDLQWMSVEAWGDKPTEHEEFIPESRIEKFRRKRDGGVVWDRRARIDTT